MRFADGEADKVWEKTLPQAEYERFKVTYHVLTMKASETGVTVRFISDEQLPGATAVDPSLEYGCMCKIPQTGRSKWCDTQEPAASM